MLESDGEIFDSKRPYRFVKERGQSDLVQTRNYGFAQADLSFLGARTKEEARLNVSPVGTLEERKMCSTKLRQVASISEARVSHANISSSLLRRSRMVKVSVDDLFSHEESR